MFNQNILKDLGYNLVSLPKEDLEPLQVLAKTENGFVQKIGTLKDLFLQGDEVPKPTVKKNKIAPNISGHQVIGLSGDMKVKFLKSFKNLFNVDVSSEFKNKSKIVFSYDDAKLSEVKTLISLDAFIRDAEINEKRIGSYEKQLKKNEIFITTAVLKSKKFEIKEYELDSGKVGVTANEAQTDSEFTVKGEKYKATTNVISYSGNEELVFAVQAVKLIYNKKFWNKKKAEFKIKAETGVVLRSEEDFPTENLDFTIE